MATKVTKRSKTTKSNRIVARAFYINLNGQKMKYEHSEVRISTK